MITLKVYPGILTCDGGINMWMCRAGKNRFSGKRKSVLLKASSGECYAPRSFLLLVTLEAKHVGLNMYLTVYQMKWITLVYKVSVTKKVRMVLR